MDDYLLFLKEAYALDEDDLRSLSVHVEQQGSGRISWETLLPERSRKEVSSILLLISLGDYDLEAEFEGDHEDLENLNDRQVSFYYRPW